MHVPTFVAHVADAKEVDGSVAFAHYHAVVDFILRDAGVDCDVEGAEGVFGGAVEVGAFGGLADSLYK